jgi:hypothetical protein
VTVAPDSDESNEEQPYALARDREMREIIPPTRYGYSNFVYCLAIAEIVEFVTPQIIKK